MTSFYTNVLLRGNKFLIREIIDGKATAREVRAKPYLFLPDDNGEYRSHNGRKLAKQNFSSINEARKFLEENKDVENYPIYGIERWSIPFINDTWPGEIKFDLSKLKIAYLDIEVASDEGMPDIRLADKPVTAISLKIGERILAFGCGDWRPEKPLVAYHRCVDERDLIEAFLNVWERENVDIVSGWNIRLFDIPYLVKRIVVLFDEDEVKRLSPWGFLKKDKVRYRNRMFDVHEPAGISILDYMMLYRKFNLEPRESYALNHIAHVELGKNKLDYSEYETLTQLHRLNFSKFMTYNVLDADLVSQLEDKLRIIELACTIAYDAKVNFEDVFASSRPWDARIHNFLIDKKIAVPTKIYNDDEEEAEEKEYEGGWVKEPLQGLHDFVVSFDISSQYPRLISTYGISPDNFRGRLEDEITIDDLLKGAAQKFLPMLQEKDLTMTANLCLYTRKRRGFLPVLMDRLFEKKQFYEGEKKKVEQEYEKTKSEGLQREIDRYDVYISSVKVLLNSGYGVLGNKYFRWFDVNNAEAITSSGQLTIRTAGIAVNNFMNNILQTKGVEYWIASDTDSIFMNFGPLVEKVFAGKTVSFETKLNFVDRACKTEFEPLLARTFETLAASMNAKENQIRIKREAISRKAIWTKKKNYVLEIWDTNGVRYQKAKIKFKGIKGFKPSNPECSRLALAEAIAFILHDNLTQLRKFVSDYERRFKLLPMEDVSIPKSISGLNKYAGDDEDTLYKAKVPIQVRGALIYNDMLRRLNIRGLPPVFDGDKGRYCYLKEPNPTGENVITIVNALPQKFGLEKYIDYETMFDKTFMTHLNSLMDSVGWSIEDYATLEGIF